LACASGLDTSTVARKLGVAQPTVSRWRQRFIDERLDGLLSEPLPGSRDEVD
jgi:transposase-like protein